MLTLVERTSQVETRLPVRRWELSRKGVLLAELASAGEPRWVAFGEGGELELDPECDEELPLSARLAQLRREQSAAVLAWRPGRRMVVRLQHAHAPGGAAIVKALRTGRLRKTLERHLEGVRAARAAGLVAAEVLTVEPPSAAFFQAELFGERLPVSASAAASFSHLGAALARFQAAGSGPELELHGVEAELGVLDSLAAKAQRLRGCLPAGWETARAIGGAALEAVRQFDAVRTHRDLHDGQLLRHEDTVGLLDFDLLCLADGALDPANLLAHLELRGLQGAAEPREVEACAAAFRAGYGRVGDPELERRLAAWSAATFLRLALVYHLRPPYSHLGPTLVERGLARLRELRHGAR